MTRQQALSVLQSQKEALHQQFGVTRLGLFGSVARDQANDESDVDVVVEMPPDFYAMGDVKETLEHALHARIDLVRYRERMNPFLKKRIDRDAVYV